MKNLPVYLILGFVAGEALKSGNLGLAAALSFAAVWVMITSYLAAKKQAEDQKYLKEINAILIEKGY